MMKKGILYLTLILINLTLCFTATAQQDYDILGYEINQIICTALNIIYWVIGFLAAMVIIIRGLQYTAAEDPDDRTLIKNQIIHVIIATTIALMVTYVIHYLIENTNIIPFTCTSGGYIHPGECGGGTPGYITYCCCEKNGASAFRGNRCPYGTSVSGVGACLLPAQSCNDMCQSRGYLNGVGDISGERCDCLLGTIAVTSTLPVTTTVAPDCSVIVEIICQTAEDPIIPHPPGCDELDILWPGYKNCCCLVYGYCCPSTTTTI